MIGPLVVIEHNHTTGSHHPPRQHSVEERVGVRVGRVNVHEVELSALMQQRHQCRHGERLVHLHHPPAAVQRLVRTTAGYRSTAYFFFPFSSDS